VKRCTCDSRAQSPSPSRKKAPAQNSTTFIRSCYRLISREADDLGLSLRPSRAVPRAAFSPSDACLRSFPTHGCGLLQLGLKEPTRVPAVLREGRRGLRLVRRQSTNFVCIPDTSVFSQEKPGEGARLRKIQLRRFNQRSRPRWTWRTLGAGLLSSRSPGFCGLQTTHSLCLIALNFLINHTAAQEPHERAGIHSAADGRSTI
jgi:hypothetical protein